MILCLSLVSSHGAWALLSSDASQVHRFETWTDTESTGLSAGLDSALSRLLNGQPLSIVSRIGVVSGPGAFTGLRIASSYAQGLHRSLGVPLFGIPTYDLIGRPFYLPMQHQKARHLTQADLAQAPMECLHVSGSSPEQVSTERPTGHGNELVLGLKDSSAWPSSEQLRAGAAKNLSTSLQIQYGLEPKISGARTT